MFRTDRQISKLRSDVKNTDQHDVDWLSLSQDPSQDLVLSAYYSCFTGYYNEILRGLTVLTSLWPQITQRITSRSATFSYLKLSLQIRVQLLGTLIKIKLKLLLMQNFTFLLILNITCTCMSVSHCLAKSSPPPPPQKKQKKQKKKKNTQTWI